jgi:hypothetical protein
MQQKMNPTYLNSHYSQQNQSYYNSLSPMGTNGFPSQPNPNMQMTKNGPVSFLPRISGATAFSNYTVHTGNSSNLTNKVTHFHENIRYPFFPDCRTIILERMLLVIIPSCLIDHIKNNSQLMFVSNIVYLHLITLFFCFHFLLLFYN